MDSNLEQIKEKAYDTCGLAISNFIIEAESKDYNACQFSINGLNIISRSAKITLKKIGQFVTFWKRINNGPIEPFNEFDPIDFFVINVKSGHNLGQFVFPKSALIKNGIITSGKKEGKRGFRVYPSWVNAESKQAKRTQKWQLNYFYQITPTVDLNRVTLMYNNIES